MMDLLQHLVPDFSQLFTDDPRAISGWFWIFTACIFGVSLFFVLVHYFRFRRRLAALRSLLKGQSKETLAGDRRETLQQAQDLDAKNIGMLWREFDESLVVSPDQKQLFNTLDAEHFFNARTLAGGLTGSRLLAAAPSFLVAIGVLGTFVGLTVGLGGLETRGGSDDVESLKVGINTLISGAAVAFMTSVWGVAFSLFLNFIEKMFERSALRNIQAIQHHIDFLYPRIPAEQSLVHIAEYSRESKEALQELHERIGDRLQETLSGMTEAMQTALADTLNNIMGPAIQSLVTNASQQSTQALEHLVARFMDGMNEMGRSQGQQMHQAAVDVNAAVGNMAERMDNLFTALSDQQNQQLKSNQAQSEQFATQLERITGSAAKQQQQLESQFMGLMGGLTTQLDEQLEAADQREQKRQASLEKILADSNVKQAAIWDQVSQSANDQMNSMESHQQTLLANIAEATQAAQEQSLKMALQHEQLLTKLTGATEASRESSKHMETTANHLGLLATRIKESTDSLGNQLITVTQNISAVTAQNENLATQLSSHMDGLSKLQLTLREGAQSFEQAAALARDGFEHLQSTQTEFLSGVRSEFNALGVSLSTQVASIEKQAEEWLRTYSSEVSQQTHERMDQWNKETLSFANQMQATVQAINNIVDELEVR